MVGDGISQKYTLDSRIYFVLRTCYKFGTTVTVCINANFSKALLPATLQKSHLHYCGKQQAQHCEENTFDTNKKTEQEQTIWKKNHDHYPATPPELNPTPNYIKQKRTQFQ